MRNWNFAVYTVLAVAISSMAASLFWLISSSAEDLRAAQAAHRDNLVYTAAQADYERLTLLDFLDRFAHGGATREEMVARFDVFWSRLESNSSGIVGKNYLALPGAPEAVALARTTLAALEAEIMALRADDRAKIAEVKEALRSLGDPLHEVTLAAVGRQAERFSAAYDRRERADHWFVVFLIGVLASGCMLVALLGVERYRLNALSRSLEGRVVERTKALSESKARLEQALAQTAQSRREAEAANKAKTEFLAAMSHELRTPLNAVIGFSHMMMKETLGPIGTVTYRDYASDIHDAGQHLLSIINDILDVAKIESGFEGLQESEVAVGDLLDAAVRLVGYRAQRKEIEIEVKLAPGISVLWADERKLKQCLVNLLSNAVKFTPKGGSVSVVVSIDQNGDVMIQVWDTGIGIAPEDIPKALTPFGQVESGLNRRHQGTGLGLPLTRGLVELHGGALELQSNLGTGTTATLRLPGERIVRPAGAVA